MNKMARSYDEQDFISNLNIEVAREGDMLEKGHDLDKFTCDKNPGHSGFIPFKDLELEHLPQEVRNTEALDCINRWGKHVVRLVVDMKDGKKTWSGSGYVYKNGNEYQIKTNNHVVKTDNEVKHCTVEFFYDSQDRSKVLICRGEKLAGTCPFKDLSFFSFNPVPDFLDQLDVNCPIIHLPSIVIRYKNNLTVKCHTHPRYVSADSKCKSSLPFYHTSINLNNPQIEIMFMSLVDNSVSYLKSSYFKFQPIPCNIQKLSRIEIHIDGDKDNSRVISGEVVKFGDEFVVKISKPIFQDEVMTCRLVWNGNVISRGTRLYFQRFKSREFFTSLTQIDLDQQLKPTSPFIWLFEFQPLPRGVGPFHDMINSAYLGQIMCCIGHPHAGMKMVTFGRWLGKSVELMSTDQPGKNCQSMEISCMKYSCKTCPGSSGSPVFVPSNAFPMICGLTHFMGKNFKTLIPNGELIENINTAWG